MRVLFLLFLLLSSPFLWVGTWDAKAAEQGDAPDNYSWSFGGLFGRFDRDQLQRGFQVYQEVCASCHSLERISFRNLSEAGGPEFDLNVIRALAREAEYGDIDSEGEEVTRAGRLSDILPSPYANSAQAAASLGASPPDLSLITKSRTSVRALPVSFLDALSGRSSLLGADYVASFLQGYEEAPEGEELAPGQYWNRYFAGHIIAMAPPLEDELVEYSQADVPQTVEQYALDVTAFLHWAAEPHLEKRKSIGFIVIVFLIVFSVLLYFSYVKMWARLKND